MARKRFEEEHENHERWLVSYADLVTLLFAFFVVMYAISSVNEGKYKVVSNSLGSAFRGDMSLMPPAVITDPNAVPSAPESMPKPGVTVEALLKEKQSMTTMAKDILKALAPLVNQGKVRVTQSNRGISIEINASVLFSPGEARLTDESSSALRVVAKVLKADNHGIQIEGYTDNLPIRNSMFASNWELSAVRASSVVRLFAENGIGQERLIAVGHGANQAVASNDTPEGRQRNRRVQILILSNLPDAVTELPIQIEPGASSDAPG